MGDLISVKAATALPNMKINVAKVLLLNPPGDKTYLRDYYCSKVSKTDYIYQPTDLVVLSGILSKDFQISAIDAIPDRMSYDECEKKILEINPDAIIFLSGSVSKKYDFEFLSNVKEKMKNLGKEVLFIGSGDVFMEDAKKVLQENSFLDAAILDFSSPDIVDFLKGQEPSRIVYRSGDKIVYPTFARDRGKTFVNHIPQHQLFMNKNYRYPFVRKYPFATVLTDYGCPYRCSFCIISEIGFKVRPVESVIEELKLLKSLGIKSIYFADQTFGVYKKRAAEICQAMIDNKFNFEWVCFSRVDVVNEESLKLMKAAGCRTIMFGVESGNQDMLNRYQKDLTKDQLRETFALCKKVGIKTLGTFIIGLPGETRETAMETIDFVKEIEPDFAAFNVAVPRMGTDMRKEAVQSGMAAGIDEMDQSGSYTVMGSGGLSPEEIAEFRRKAVKEFYFRPKYFYNQMKNIKSFGDFDAYARNGFFLVRNLFSWSK